MDATVLGGGRLEGMFRSNHLVLLALSLALAACSSSAADEPSDATTIAKGCVKNRCDEKIDSASDYCSRCLDACVSASYDCDVTTACNASCSPPSECSDADYSACVQEDFIVTLPTAKSAEIASECGRLVARGAECGWKFSSTPQCDTWAKTERPEHAAAFGCQADLSCDATEDDWVSCLPPASDFGDRLCEGFSALCGKAFCIGPMRANFNAQGGWLKETVMTAAFECAEQATCADGATCLGAWVKAAAIEF